ncbi:MAG TPA: NAD(P)/FAD-dependent oxidoreductase [Candidatus Bathyarchaeia archaeon]
MKTVPSAIVVGAGPAGCFTAANLAKFRIDTTVLEEHAEIGVPTHCAGHLSIRSLKNLGLYPLPKGIVENTYSAANFYSPNGTKFAVRLKRPATCTVNRELFDKFLAEKAKAFGARFCLSTRVGSLKVKDGAVTGVNIEKNGFESQYSARIVVDAEGIGSRLLRQACLTPFGHEKLVYSVETDMENIQNIEEDAVEVFMGRDYSPGFYAWIIPRHDGTAKVGLATRTGNPKVFLQRLMHNHPVASKKLGRARITRTAFHSITLGGPISQAYANGLLAVGDVASQVKPTTGGGVVFGMTCARIAAEVVKNSFEKDNFSAEHLRTYQRGFVNLLGFDFKVMLRIRRFLDSLSDERLDEALGICKRLGLDKALGDVDEIDFQGRTLLKMVTKPAAFAMLAYFVLVYMTTNA